MFLGLPDPGLSVRDTDPDAKIVRKTLIPTVFDFFMTFCL
jgi:hypothetical protein